MQLRYVSSELGQGLRRNLTMHLAVILTLVVSLIGGMLVERVLIRPVEGGQELTLVTVTLGLFILVINAVLIWAYTLGCHSCRNIIGGRLKHFSKHPVRYRMWGWVSKLNAKHQPLAWASMFSVMIADIYVMLVASGAIDDLRIFN